jgi:hypothetical protein
MNDRQKKIEFAREGIKLGGKIRGNALNAKNLKSQAAYAHLGVSQAELDILSNLAILCYADAEAMRALRELHVSLGVVLSNYKNKQVDNDDLDKLLHDATSYFYLIIQTCAMSVPTC